MIPLSALMQCTLAETLACARISDCHIGIVACACSSHSVFAVECGISPVLLTYLLTGGCTSAKLAAGELW
eukprot:13878052-Alexandrium_andersonii.AAC.1